MDPYQSMARGLGAPGLQDKQDLEVPASHPHCMEAGEIRGAVSCQLEALGRQDFYKWQLSYNFTDCGLSLAIVVT